jgi:hypothetical protein
MNPNFLKSAGNAEAEPDSNDLNEAAESEAPESAGAMAAGELCVPASALAMPDEQEQMTNPEPGDVVDLQVQAKVSRIEGENAYIVPESINGQKLPEAGAEAEAPGPEEQDAAQFGELQDMARQQPMG